MDIKDEQKIYHQNQLNSQNHKIKQKIQQIESQYTKQYCNAFINYAEKDLQNYREQLRQNHISFNKNAYQKQLSIYVIDKIQGKRIMSLAVSFSYFTFQIVLMHFNQLSFSKQFKVIGSGSFGSIHQCKLNIKQFIIKRNRYQSFIYRDLKQNYNPNYKQIQNKLNEVIQQYCLYKLFSVFKIGPYVNNHLGFDLLVYRDSIQFTMQKCENLNDINIQNFTNDLFSSLKLMHSLKIIHGDIKPQNILFSPKFNKYVFIDFGLSKILKQNIGQKTLTYYFGTYYYSSLEMKQLFTKNQLQFIDLYYNDFIGLEKTINAMNQKKFILQYEKNKLSFQNHILERQYINLLLNIQLAYYIYTTNIEQIKKIIQENKKYFDILPLTHQIIFLMKPNNKMKLIRKILIQNFHLQVSQKYYLTNKQIEKEQIQFQNRILQISNQFQGSINDIMIYLLLSGQNATLSAFESKKQAMTKIFQNNNLSSEQYWQQLIAFVKNLYTSKAQIQQIFEIVKQKLNISQWNNCKIKQLQIYTKAQQISLQVMKQYKINLYYLNEKNKKIKISELKQFIRQEKIESNFEFFQIHQHPLYSIKLKSIDLKIFSHIKIRYPKVYELIKLEFYIEKSNFFGNYNDEIKFLQQYLEFIEIFKPSKNSLYVINYKYRLSTLKTYEIGIYNTLKNKIFKQFANSINHCFDFQIYALAQCEKLTYLKIYKENFTSQKDQIINQFFAIIQNLIKFKFQNCKIAILLHRICKFYHNIQLFYPKFNQQLFYNKIQHSLQQIVSQIDFTKQKDQAIHFLCILSYNIQRRQSSKSQQYCNSNIPIWVKKKLNEIQILIKKLFKVQKQDFQLERLYYYILTLFEIITKEEQIKALKKMYNIIKINFSKNLHFKKAELNILCEYLKYSKTQNQSKQIINCLMHLLHCQNSKCLSIFSQSYQNIIFAVIFEQSKNYVSQQIHINKTMSLFFLLLNKYKLRGTFEKNFYNFNVLHSFLIKILKQTAQALISQYNIAISLFRQNFKYFKENYSDFIILICFVINPEVIVKNIKKNERKMYFNNWLKMANYLIPYTNYFLKRYFTQTMVFYQLIYNFIGLVQSANDRKGLAINLRYLRNAFYHINNNIYNSFIEIFIKKTYKKAKNEVFLIHKDKLEKIIRNKNQFVEIDMSNNLYERNNAKYYEFYVNMKVPQQFINKKLEYQSQQIRYMKEKYIKYL